MSSEVFRQGYVEYRKRYAALWSGLAGRRSGDADPTRSYFAMDGPIFVFAFHEGTEIGPVMLARIAKKTGLKPEDFLG
jgi:hypothetical protein